MPKKRLIYTALAEVGIVLASVLVLFTDHPLWAAALAGCGLLLLVVAVYRSRS